MGSASKAQNNIYYRARIAAAQHNDDLSSREKAAFVLGIDRTKLARIELDLVIPFPEEVRLMADCYNAPELLNYHCTHDCPIGCCTMAKADLRSIEQIALRSYGVLQNAQEIREALIDIAADGVIDAGERPRVAEILQQLKDIGQVADELTILAKKIGIQ